jgi:hypothetical protein
MAARMTRVLPLLLLFALAGLLLGLRPASAEYKGNNQPPYYLNGYTSSMYQVSEGGGNYTWYADSFSESYYCGSTCSLSTPYYVAVQSRGFNNDIYWHMVDQQTHQCGSSPDYGSPFIRNFCTKTPTISTFAWGTLQGRYPSFYVTSWHALIPYAGYPTMVAYTSNDGTRSNNSCFATAGC